MPTKKTATKKSPAKKSSSADAVDTQLARYRSMRDFHVTAEPAGGSAKASPKRRPTQWPFVIQKHAASHLHYDFRLGWNGVLKSWAVAKGPSYYTGDRRLAVEVEDHPMEYGGFEGIIPKGQYGGGTVMVWDQGTWHPQPGYEDVDKALREGSLKFEMDGTKMHGKWTLIRMAPRPSSSGRWGSSSKPNWLLIKEHDDFERGQHDPCITEEAPNSAVTNRTMEQIAAQEDHVWNSKETAGTGQAWYRQAAASPTAKFSAAKSPREKKSVTLSEGRSPKSKDLPPTPDQHSRPTLSPQKSKAPTESPPLTKLPRETQPDFVPPELALEAATPPATNDWLHELKLDGYRIQARKSGNKIALLTRKGLDWTHRMSAVADALQALSAKAATLDGEVVVLGPDGNSSFANLQASFQDNEQHQLTYFAFDLLHLDGHNTRELPLRERKQLLAQVLPAASDLIKLSEHIEGNAADIFHHACELHAEGIISKRASSPYRSARSSDWLKSKCLREQEFVIAGYTDSTEGPGRIGSLLLGYYDGSKLLYAGRTGTGFTQKLKRQLYVQLSKLAIPKPLADRVPPEARRGAHWVKPELVAQVRFATWTADNLVRQAAFLGLREDKSPTEVTREAPAVAPRPKTSKTASKTTSSVLSTSSPSLKNVRLTHPNKILDPESGLTKQQLAEYYATVAPFMLPHISNRPLSLVRCPEGAGKPCFYQKHVNHMLPPGIGSIAVPDKKTGVPDPYITLNTEDALIGLAQMGVLEIHPWGSKNDDLEHPDRLIFDFDPDESLPWFTLCEAAAEARKRLKKLGLESFLKLTGGKGLHVVAPIQPKLTWPEIKDIAYKFVSAMERSNPSLFLTKMTKSFRINRIYLDYLRNERGATAVAPFSPRARLGTHVSLPLPWSALSEPTRPVFSVNDLSQWESRLRTDPWKKLLALRQPIDPKKFANL
jgi:bifunctional non-homologous end joining protein LigD